MRMIKHCFSWDTFNIINQDKRTSFEKLCRVIFKMKYCDPNVVFHSNPNNPGIEIEPVHSKEGNCRISFQSKFFEGRVNYSDIKDSCRKAVKYYAGNLDVLYLFCNRDIKTDCNSFCEIKTILREKGIDIVPITNESVLELARDFWQRSSRYFDVDFKQNSVNLNNAIKRQITDFNLFDYEYEALKEMAEQEDSLYYVGDA